LFYGKQTQNFRVEIKKSEKIFNFLPQSRSGEKEQWRKSLAGVFRGPDNFDPFTPISFLLRKEIRKL